MVTATQTRPALIVTRLALASALTEALLVHQLTRSLGISLQTSDPWHPSKLAPLNHDTLNQWHPLTLDNPNLWHPSDMALVKRGTTHSQLLSLLVYGTHRTLALHTTSR